MALDLFDSVIIDNHAHSLLNGHLELDAIGFRRAFSESMSLSYFDQHAGNASHYRNMIKSLKEIFAFETEDQFIDVRQHMKSEEHINTLWDDAAIGAILIDDGFLSDSMISVKELASICGRPIFRIVRIETVLERLIMTSTSLAEIEKGLEAELTPGPDNQISGVKSIAAYRGGLNLDLEIEFISAEKNLDDLRKTTIGKVVSPTEFRIERCSLYHYLLARAFQIAGQNNLPIQIHTGIGDSDLDLHKSNPSLLTPLFREKRFSACRFVFLHCYPYVREASYLCSVFPNAFMDLSLSVSLASVLAKDLFREAIALAPSSKLLAGTDGHSVPETHWYGAIVTKNALTSVYNQLIEENYLDTSDAIDAVERILFKNCRELYQLEGLF